MGPHRGGAQGAGDTTVRPPSRATQAREGKGLTLAAVARMLRTTPEALRRLERYGGWSFLRAEKLARLYGVSVDCFPPRGATRRLAPSILREMRR